MKKYSFNTAYTQAQDLYGVELTLDDFENLGIIAWGRIGNKNYRLYKYQTKPCKTDAGEFYIELPCNVDILESVTAGYEDYQKTTPTTSENAIGNGSSEDYVESRKFNTPYLYSSGKFIKYHRVDNTLYLSENFEIVNVLYKGVIVDDDGLPFINEKEVDAIAVFCAFSKMYKKGLVTGDNSTIQRAQMLREDWKSLCTQSRVAEYINQNEMDELLNVSTSWDRKRFGKSFKPIK